MTFLGLLVIGGLVGLTTALFGFGGGFVTVPIVTVVDAGLGGDAIRVATATSALVMLVNAGIATGATDRDVLARLRGSAPALLLLAVGGAVGAAVSQRAPSALVRWGFVVYVAATVADLLLRPGFFRPRGPRLVGGRGAGTGGVRTGLALPIGTVAAFLGVGGSVMTVPLMRRSGASMREATSLANPLTLAIVAPAAALTLATSGPAGHGDGLVGAVDVRCALALLVGAVPVIVLLRRRPLPVPDVAHGWGYLALLVAAGAAVALTA